MIVTGTLVLTLDNENGLDWYETYSSSSVVVIVLDHAFSESLSEIEGTVMMMNRCSLIKNGFGRYWLIT